MGDASSPFFDIFLIYAEIDIDGGHFGGPPNIFMHCCDEMVGGGWGTLVFFDIFLIYVEMNIECGHFGGPPNIFLRCCDGMVDGGWGDASSPFSFPLISLILNLSTIGPWNQSTLGTFFRS